MTTNLIDGQASVIASGKLSDAIRATVSIPLLFRPYKHEKALLVDGGLSSPIPIHLIKDMGADIAIGVNLYHENEFATHKFTMTKIALRSTRIVLHNLAMHDIAQADIAISPDTSSIITTNSLRQYSLAELKKIIKIGEDSARKEMPKIKAFLSKAAKA